MKTIDKSTIYCYADARIKNLRQSIKNAIELKNTKKREIAKCKIQARIIELKHLKKILQDPDKALAEETKWKKK